MNAITDAARAARGRKPRAVVGVLGIGVAALTLAAGSSPVGAATTGKAAPAVSVANPFALPAGFNVAVSPMMIAMNGRQTHGLVACPGTTKPVGGGVYAASQS